MDSFKTQRATTKSIETTDDISGWETIGDLDKDLILEKFEKLPSFNKGSQNAAVALTSNAHGTLSKVCLLLYYRLNINETILTC